MGLCCKTTRWSDQLWSSHVESSHSARYTVEQGKARQQDFTGFAEDIHSRLYLTHEPGVDNGPEWANTLHEAASELAEWKQLKLRCQHSGLAAGIATEEILSVLLDSVPQSNDQQDSDEELPYDPRGGGPGQGDGKPVAWTDKGDGEKAEIRAKLRKAIKEARDKVVEAEESLDGLESPLQLNRPGSAVGEQVTLKDLEHIRQAHQVVRNSYRLRQIAELAGRLRRKASTHKKTRVSGSCGEVVGVELSGDIPRILPGELAGLRGSKIERLATLSKIVEKRALSYKLRAEKTETRGPIVVLQDLSSSMRGDRDIWAKAVALALLSTATEQKRSWTLIGFEAEIKHEDTVEAGEATPRQIEAILSHAPRGGTEFDPPLKRAVEIIKESASFKKADIILITDGEAELSAEVASQVKDLVDNAGLSLYLIGIGTDFAITQSAAARVATRVTCLATTQNEDDVLFDAINL